MSDSQIAVQQNQVTPMDLSQKASAAGASIEQMQQLFDLKLRVEADEAKKAFNQAFTAFKAEAAVIVKNVDVKAGPLVGTKYANLFGVCNSVIPVMAKHGLSHSWRLTRDEPAWMEVTCTIRHSLGYSESVSMGAAPDTGPGRNAIQARGSAKSYLERYTLLGITGMAASDQDDDGRATASAGPEPPRMAEDDIRYHLEQIDAATDEVSLKKAFAAGYKIAQDMGDKATVTALMRAKDAKKKGFPA